MFGPDNNLKKQFQIRPSTANNNNIRIDFQNSDPTTFMPSSPKALKLSKHALNFRGNSQIGISLDFCLGLTVPF